MSCITVSPEKARNIWKNHGLLFNLTKDSTFEDIVETLNYLQDNVILNESSDPDEDSFYTFMGERIKHRPSKLASESYARRRGKKEVIKDNAKPNNKMKKAAGIFLHDVLANMVMSIYNNDGKMAAIKSQAKKGNFRIADLHLQVLNKQAQIIVDEINEIQNSIDPTKKAFLQTEQRTVDSTRDVGGTMDVFAVFSDKSALMYDFKTTHSWPGNYQDNQLTDVLLGIDKVQDHDLTMSEYRKIAEERLGITYFRRNRLLPIHIRLVADQQTKALSNVFEIVEAGEHMSKFLRAVPLRGEKTKYIGLNNLLESQWATYNKLSKKLKTASMAEKDRLKDKLKRLSFGIQTTIVKGDISDIMYSARLLVDEVDKKLKQLNEIPQEEGQDIKQTLRDLSELYDETLIYTDIIDNTNTYFEDLEKERPDLYKEMINRFKILSHDINKAHTKIKLEQERRILDQLPEQYKDTQGNLIMLKELGFFEKNFSRISEIDHPVFKLVWNELRSQIHDVRQYVKEVNKVITPINDELFKWAKEQGMSRQDAFNKIINFDRGELVNPLNKEYFELLNELAELSITDKNKAIMIYKDMFEIKNSDSLKNELKNRYENIKEYYKGVYLHEGPQVYQRKLREWIKNNDLLNSDESWLSSHNLRHLKLKEKYVDKYKSDEYKYIEQHKPLLNYYTTYRNFNKQFAQMLNIQDYRQLPPTFIANIRKEMTDYLGRESGGILGGFQEFIDSFNVRQEDIYLADKGPDGELKRNIPILFVNPLRNKNGEIDNTQKSYDLTSSLVTLAKVAKNYETINKLEPYINALKQQFADADVEVTTSLNQKIKGKIKDYATTKGVETDTYKSLENFIDYYLYGIKFKTKNVGSMNMTKLALRLKQYHAKRALAFAVIPSAGAFIAGKAAAFFEGKKGIYYNNKQMKLAYKRMVTDHKKFKAASYFFDIYAEDPTEKIIFDQSIRGVSKFFDARNLFYPLRKVDENINDAIMGAMLENFGIDKEGNLVRLNRKGVDLKNIKTLWDLISYDEKTGRISAKGLNSDAYLSFRAAIKKASSSIIGSLSQEEISKLDTDLVLNLMSAFKSWMPGIVRERTGKLTYDEDGQALRWGRFRAAFSELGLTQGERDERRRRRKGEENKLTSNQLESGFKMNEFIRTILVPNLAKATFDLITFGGLKSALGQKYTDESGNTFTVRTNIERARRRYIEWMAKNSRYEGEVTFDDYLEIKEGQIRAMLVELRAILGFMSTLMFLAGGDDNDDVPRYMENYFTRTLFKMLTKGNSELTFIWNPDELINLLSNPLPMASLLSSLKKTIKNTADETRDFVAGENSPYDKSPAFYYTLQWAYGGAQINRLFELTEGMKKSPYYNQSSR